MSPIRSRGFAPEKASKPSTVNEFQLLAENLNLLLEHEEEIMSQPRYFYCEMEDAFLSMPYISGDGLIPLGVLMLLWRGEVLKDVCSDCGGEVYIVGTGGSPLSGNHSWWGCCRQCGKRQKGHKPTFRELWNPIRDALLRFRLEPAKEPAGSFKLPWKAAEEKADGGSLGNRMMEEFQPVDLSTLIRELKGE